MSRHRIGGDAEQLEFNRESTPCQNSFFYAHEARRAKHPKKGVITTALTRKLLNALGIDAEKIEQIIEAHTETTDALKKERDTAMAEADQYKADAEKLPAVQQELDGLKNAQSDNPYKEQYEKEHEAFETYKKEVEAKQTAEKQEKAYRKLLKDAGVSEGITDLIIKGDPLEIEFDEKGEIKDAATLTSGLKTKWAKYVVEEHREGIQTHNDPAGGAGTHGDDGGKGLSRAAQIAASYAKDRYGVTPNT